MIDLLSYAAGDLALDPAKHENVCRVYEPQTESHRVEPFFGMILIGPRIDDHPATKLALDVLHLDVFGWPTVHAEGVSIIDLLRHPLCRSATH